MKVRCVLEVLASGLMNSDSTLFFIESLKEVEINLAVKDLSILSLVQFRETKQSSTGVFAFFFMMNYLYEQQYSEHWERHGTYLFAVGWQFLAPAVCQKLLVEWAAAGCLVSAAGVCQNLKVE